MRQINPPTRRDGKRKIRLPLLYFYASASLYVYRNIYTSHRFPEASQNSIPPPGSMQSPS